MTQIDLTSPVAGPYILGRAVAAALDNGDIDTEFAAALYNEIFGGPVCLPSSS